LLFHVESFLTLEREILHGEALSKVKINNSISEVLPLMDEVTDVLHDLALPNA
jgi:hypothetical protein